MTRSDSFFFFSFTQVQSPPHYTLYVNTDKFPYLHTVNLTLLQLEQTTGSSGQRGTGPPTEPGEGSQMLFYV